jgi:hypothetical protein
VGVVAGRAGLNAYCVLEATHCAPIKKRALPRGTSFAFVCRLLAQRSGMLWSLLQDD